MKDTINNRVGKIFIIANVFTIAILTSFASFLISGEARAQGIFGPPSSGKTLVTLKNRHPKGTIIVSFADRKVYKILDRKKAISYPIAIPKTNARWSGTLNVSRKAVNPGWTPTASMRKENPKLPAFVKGGSKINPLGVRALYLGDTLYRIHGTDAPWTIGKAVSRGCIRMYNKDVIDLYNRTSLGTKVLINWKKYRVASFDQFNGRQNFADMFATD